MIRKLLNYLLNGRPMTKLVFCFTDIVTGERVYLFVDGYKRYWLATSPWARFRMQSEHYDAWLLQDGSYDETRTNNLTPHRNSVLH